METKQAPFPRSFTVDATNAQPDLPTAFVRWVSVGELPPTAVLAEFVGDITGTPPYTLRAVGAKCGKAEGYRPEPDELEEWETLCQISEPRLNDKGKPRAPRRYMVFNTSGALAEAEPEPVEPETPAEPAADPFAVACPKCNAPAGAKCRNYKGQNKFTCKERAPVIHESARDRAERAAEDKDRDAKQD